MPPLPNSFARCQTLSSKPGKTDNMYVTKNCNNIWERLRVFYSQHTRNTTASTALKPGKLESLSESENL